MAENWLEIPGENINVQEIMRQIRQRIAAREGVESTETDEPESIAASLWEEMIGDQVGLAGLPLNQRECDIVPRIFITSIWLATPSRLHGYLCWRVDW